MRIIQLAAVGVFFLVIFDECWDMMNFVRILLPSKSRISKEHPIDTHEKYTQQNMTTFSTNSYAFQELLILGELLFFPLARSMRGGTTAFSYPIVHAFSHFFYSPRFGINDKEQRARNRSLGPFYRQRADYLTTKPAMMFTI